MTVTPQHEISKTLNYSKIPLKILNVYFWGTSVDFWGTNVYFRGTNRCFRFFLNLLFVAWGLWDSVARGAP